MTIKKSFLFKCLGGLVAVCSVGTIGAIYACNCIERYNTPTFDGARLEHSKKMLAISIAAREIERTAAWDSCMKSVLADPETQPLLEKKKYYENKLTAPEGFSDCVYDGIKLSDVCDAIDARVEERVNQLVTIREIDNRIKCSRDEISNLRRDSIECAQWQHASRMERVKKNWNMIRNRRVLAKHLGQLVR